MKLAEKNGNYPWCYEQHSSIFEIVKVCSIDFEKNQSVGRTITISRQTKFQTLPPVDHSDLTSLHRDTLQKLDPAQDINVFE